MYKYYKVPESIENDILNLEKEIEKFKKGETPANKFMGFRVPLGIYEQRQNNTYMMRIRIPGGGISASQLKVIGEICNKYKLTPHITTRQDIQLQNTKLEDLAVIYRELYKIGLTCKGGGGNTVRNITACQLSGICANELFSVLPYSIALTEYMIQFQSSYNLPRKLKIAFSGCSEDCALATVNDLGFIAKIKNGKRGFSVWIAGKMGMYSKAAEKLEDFISDDEIANYAEATKRIFDKYGNRQNKHKARLTYVLDKLGLEEFKKLFKQELNALKTENPIKLQIREIPVNENKVASGNTPEISDTEFNHWEEVNVTTQHNTKDYSYVRITIPLGDISGNYLINLSEIISELGETNIRTTQNQNFIISNVKNDDIKLLYKKLKDKKLINDPKTNINYMVSCKGAATCKLGICLSNGLAKAITNELDNNNIHLSDLLDVTIKISGCPNSCGHHPIANFGFSGASRRINGRLAPYYNILSGGNVYENKTKISESIALIPAKNVPLFVKDILNEYIRYKTKYDDFNQFIKIAEKTIIKNLVEKHSVIPKYEENKDYYIDFGSQEEFSLAGRGAGECGAGVFDIIESDIESAKSALDKKDFYTALLYLTKSLLVTRGIDPKDDTTTFKSFEDNFIATGWVSKKYLNLIKTVPKNEDSPLIIELTNRITQLYKSMDSSLQFQINKEEIITDKESTTEKTAHKLDLKGTPCPINYVKAKLYLEGININDTLEILLDEGEPVQNTPVSLKNDGQEIVKIEKKDNYYSVIVKKRV